MAWKHVAVAIPLPGLACLSLAAALHLAPGYHPTTAAPTPVILTAPRPGPATARPALASPASGPARNSALSATASPVPAVDPPTVTAVPPSPEPATATPTLTALLATSTATAEPTASPPVAEVVHLPLTAPAAPVVEGEVAPGKAPGVEPDDVLPKGPEPAEDVASPPSAGAPASNPDQAYAFVAAFRDRCPVLLGQVPELAQRRNLSCEAAAARMILAGLGISAQEDGILSRMGRDANPHAGFRGDADGYAHHEDLRDYGAYAEVVARVLATYGVEADVRYGVTDEELRQALREGRAAVVWMTGERQPRLIEQDGYRLVEGEHALVVIGLAADGRFLVHDPWGARPNSGRSGTILMAGVPGWDLFRRMAVYVPLTGGE